MSKQIWLAIGWGVFAATFAQYASLFYAGWHIVPYAEIILAAPIAEELLKFLGYRRLRQYTVLIPLSFAYAEIMLKEFLFVDRSMYANPVVVLAFTLLALGGNVVIIGHLSMWALPYLFKFRWWTLFVAIGVHSLWNIFFVNFNDDWFRLAASPAIVILIGLFGIALYVEGKQSPDQRKTDRQQKTWKDILKFLKRKP